MRKCFYLFIILSLVFSGVSFAGWDDLLKNKNSEIVLPPYTSKVSVSKTNVMGQDFGVNIYSSSSLSFDEIKGFYLRELKKSGWEEVKTGQELQASKVDTLIFKKDKFMTSITYMPTSVEGKETRFTIGQGELPDFEKLSLPAEKNIDFAPVYPGSKQFSYSDDTRGVNVGYLSEGNIDQIVEFYKRGMSGYGWSLVGETPVQQVQSSIDISEFAEKIKASCPECPKDSMAKIPAITSPESWNADLEFDNEAGDGCKVIFTRIKTSGNGNATEIDPNDPMRLVKASDVTMVVLTLVKGVNGENY